MTSDELKLAEEYNRGYFDGKKAINADELRMEYERSKVVKRLRRCDFDELTYEENFEELCKALSLVNEGWYLFTMNGQFRVVRDRLIHLLGGDERNFSTPESYTDAGDAEQNPAETSKDASDNVSLGTPSDSDGTMGQSDGTCPNGVPNASITAELREYIDDKQLAYFGRPVGERLRVIADRIDAQFDRICEQQEHVLQSTIDHMVDNKPTPIVDGITTNLRKSMHSSMDGEWLTIEWGDFVSECDRIDNRCMDTIISVHDSMESECNKLANELARTKELLEISYAKRRAYKLHIDQMKGGSKKWRKRYEDAQTLAEVNEQECAELLELLRDAAEDYRKLQDKYDMREGVLDAAIASLKDCVVLPKDKDGVTWSFGDRFMHKGKTYEVSAMRLFETGRWGLETSECDGNFNPIAFTHAHTAEEIVRDLTLGHITEQEAVKLIKEMEGK